jgi:hypothetical protein
MNFVQIKNNEKEVCIINCDNIENISYTTNPYDMLIEYVSGESSSFHGKEAFDLYQEMVDKGIAYSS